MKLKSLFTRNKIGKGMKLPPHLEEIKNSTEFTAKEILDF
jgi:hypothetical protein